VGSKLLSAALAILPLVGLFLFAQAIYERRTLSCACVIVAGPWWIQVLLSSGAMTEMPTTGLLLAGAALSIFAVREDRTPRRRRLLAGSALLFATATSLHFASWLQLAAVIGCLFAYSATRVAGRRGVALAECAGFAIIATLFCVAWLLHNWMVTGSPLGVLEDLAAPSEVKIGGLEASWLERGLIYPGAVVYSVRALLPLVAWGIVWPFLASWEGAPRARWVLGCLGVVLLSLVSSALVGGTNVTPFRTVTALATALVPFALAPLLIETRNARPDGKGVGRIGPALAGLVLASLIVVNQQRIFLEAPTPTATPLMIDRARALRSDARALGAWLRREEAVPRRLTEHQLARPFLVVLSPPAHFKSVALEYAIGDPRRIEYVDFANSTTVRLQPGRIVISDHAIDHPRLRPVTRIASYHVYESAERRGWRMQLHPGIRIRMHVSEPDPLPDLYLTESLLLGPREKAG